MLKPCPECKMQVTARLSAARPNTLLTRSNAATKWVWSDL